MSYRRRNWLCLTTIVALTLLSARPAAALDRRLSCIDEIGRDAATKLQDACKGVSPATHPACGAANSCVLVEGEIARSCAIIGDKVASTTPACTLAPLDPAAVLQRYYRAIEERDYSTAYAMLKFDGAKEQSFTAFRDGFAHTKTTRVSPGKAGDVEGAAGSSFVTIPVTVEAELDGGTRQRFTGTYVLRAANAQGPITDIRWFIFSSDLHEAFR